MSMERALAALDPIDHKGRLVAAIVGLPHGGQMLGMYAARFSGKVHALVLQGPPIDTHAKHGSHKRMVRELSASFYHELANARGSLKRGEPMRAGWKAMHPGGRYLDQFVGRHERVECESYLKGAERFQCWYENLNHLPGGTVFRRSISGSGIARQTVVVLLRSADVSNCVISITYPIFQREQVFAAVTLLRTPADQTGQRLVPGGHIRWFIGSRTCRKAGQRSAPGRQERRGWTARVDLRHLDPPLRRIGLTRTVARRGILEYRMEHHVHGERHSIFLSKVHHWWAARRSKDPFCCSGVVSTGLVAPG